MYTGVGLSISELFLTQEVGTRAFVYASVFGIVILWFTPWIMSVKSSALAALLHDLSRVEGVSTPSSRRWYCIRSTLTFLFSILVLAAFLTYYFTTWGYLRFLEVSVIYFSSFVYGIHRAVPSQLCSMVIGLLARRLVVATEATVAKISTFLVQDGSFTCDSDVDTAVKALRDLDALIREVRTKALPWMF